MIRPDNNFGNLYRQHVWLLLGIGVSSIPFLMFHEHIKSNIEAINVSTEISAASSTRFRNLWTATLTGIVWCLPPSLARCTYSLLVGGLYI